MVRGEESPAALRIMAFGKCALTDKIPKMLLRPLPKWRQGEDTRRGGQSVSICMSPGLAATLAYEGAEPGVANHCGIV